MAEPYERARGRGQNGNGAVPRPRPDGDNGGQEMRGGVRGRRIFDEIIHSRAGTLESKKGSAGVEIQLKANYFVVRKRPEWTIHQYRIDFEPDNEVTFIRKALLRPHKEVLGRGGYLFDGTILHTSLPLPEHLTELSTTRKDGSEVKIRIRYTRSVAPTDPETFQVLNLIMRSAMDKLQLQPIGRNYFDPREKRVINQIKVELWPGYVTSIRQFENDILLNSEITNKVLRMQTLLEIFGDCSRQGGDPYENFSRVVIGSTVMTQYNNKMYRIADVDSKQNPQSTFETKTGPVSYIDYYQRRYGITIRDRNQPLLLSKPKEKDRRGGRGDELIALIPELCRATGLTDDIRNDQRIMRELATITRVGPADRLDRLQRFNRRLLTTPESIERFREWEMEIENDVIRFPARVLPAQRITFGNNGVFPPSQNADWTRALRDQRLYQPEPIQNWVVLHSFRQRGDAQNLVNCIQRSVANMRLTIDGPHFESISNENGESYNRALDMLTQRDPRCILVILPNTNAQLYQIVKKKCCVDRCVPTQVVVYNTLKKQGLMSIATKIAIQMTTKLGALPWMISIPLNKIMVCGFDSTHDTRDKRRNFGALVVALDPKNTNKYFSTVSEFRQGQMMSNDLAMNMLKALREYIKVNNDFPNKIILYRDGVGEGQLHFVNEHEVQTVADALNKAYKDAGKEPPSFGFIVVSKSLKTRLFKANNNMNPDPGTIVDDHITLPERFDFYLVSQLVRQGTVSPTSYHVLRDPGLSADYIQQFTWKMCHLYYNWCGTTRVPAVVQYAKKLAFLVGQHLHEYPQRNTMDKQLYFL